MASLRTEITEIATGLGTLGSEDPAAVFASSDAPAELRGVDATTWTRLRGAFLDREHEGEFLAAFNNGRALLRARDGLRGRTPAIVEWKGPHRDPADNPVPADLRIDHVYLVSCKYLSRVLHNASPWALFDRCLISGGPGRGGDWYTEVAPAAHQRLYEEVRRLLDGGEQLPQSVTALSTQDRLVLAAGKGESSPRTASAYGDLAATVAAVSAERWSDSLRTPTQQRAMLWRLLRLSAAPYFVLGTGAGESLRVRVATPWDWTQAWELRAFDIRAEAAGQPRVAWEAVVGSRIDAPGRATTGDGSPALCREVTIRGHVEIRWSHGRLAGSPEAKVYLDTPHRDVPGYIPLT